MIYLYAYTNFKKGLDNLRRILAIYDYLTKKGLNCEILVNEYRAQLIAKEWGYPLATTIETIKDIDAVASINDTIIIDSSEKIEGKVLNYPKDFKKVIFINSICNEIKFDGATIFNIKDENFFYKELDNINKTDKTIFIYGDSDYEKTILKNLDLFKNKGLDLYWGVYFFVKYEDILKDVFNNIIDSEEYYEVLKEYKNVITCSFEVAIEAKAAKSDVLYLNLNNLEMCKKEILWKYGIRIVDNLDIQNYIQDIELSKKIFHSLDNLYSYVK